MTLTTIEHATCPECGAEDETRHRPTCRHAPPQDWTLRPVLAGGNLGGDLDHRGRAVIPGKWYLARVYDDAEEIVAGPWTAEARARRVAELVTSPRATVVLHPWHGFAYYSPDLWVSPRDGVTTRGEEWFYMDEAWHALALSTFIPGYAALDEEARGRALREVAPRHFGEYIQRGEYR